MERSLSLIFIIAIFYITDARAGCEDYEIIPVAPIPCETKRIIVDRHNQLRAQIASGKVDSQPPAANMIELTWDDELAALAQDWADQCTTKHDPRRYINRFSVGQNIARTWTSANARSGFDLTPDFSRQIDSWFNEIKKYKRDRTNTGTGHYTQVIWSDSWAIGCGYSAYYDKEKGYTKIYVCNYGPSGNMKGHLPYVSGRPSCKNYGMYNSYQYSGLCLKPVPYSLGAYC